MIIDASAIVAYLVDDDGDAGAALRIGVRDGVAAPGLLDAEVGHALRGMVRRGRLDAERGRAAMADLADLPIDRVPYLGLLERAWDLRDNLSFYDALYVALAEDLGVPLVTLDARLRAAPGHRAEVVVLTG